MNPTNPAAAHITPFGAPSWLLLGAEPVRALCELASTQFMNKTRLPQGDGHPVVLFPGLAAAVPHIRSGRVRALAVTGLSRHALFPDLPTLDESGFKGFDAQQWYGVVGPAGLPAPIVKTLNDTLASVLALPEMRDKLSIEAIEPQPMSPDQFGEFMRADIARWRYALFTSGVTIVIPSATASARPPV